jgi:hypothetical protein
MTHTTCTTSKHRGLRAVRHLALGGVVIAALAACSGGGKSATTTTPKPASSAATSAATTAPAPTTTTTTLTTGPAHLAPPAPASAQASSANGAGDLAAPIKDQVTQAFGAYLDAAVGTPLGTGGQAKLDALLTPNALAKLTPQSRDALADENMPPVNGIKLDQANLALDGFAGPDQSLSVVNATIALQVSGTTAGGAVTIKRNGTLTFVNDGTAWKIDAFNLNVERDTP